MTEKEISVWFLWLNQYFFVSYFIAMKFDKFQYDGIGSATSMLKSYQ